MVIHYSGEVRTLTQDVVTSFAAIRAGREPQSVPTPGGTVEVRPVGAKATIDNGAFSVDAEVRDNLLSGFRLLVTTRTDDPCASPREEARAARNELETARRDGVSQRGLDRLEGVLLERQRALDLCVERAGHTTGTTGRDLPIFRSRDLLRTGDGTRVDGLRVYWRVLDEVDRQALAALGIPLAFEITNDQLTALARASAGPPITIRGARTENGLLRVDFRHDDSGVSGHVRIEIEPSSSRTFTRLLEMKLVNFDTYGFKGELGELLGLVEWRLENAVEVVANRMNGQLAAALRGFTDNGATITLLGISELADGIHLSYAAGLLVNSPSDPCQAIRDDIKFIDGQVRAAKSDGASQRAIERLQAQLATRRRDLTRCEAGQAPAPPPAPPAPPRPTPPAPAPPRPRPTPTPPRPRPRPDGPPTHEP